MPTIYVKQQHNSQQGYVDSGVGKVFTNGGYNYGVKTDRVQIFRLSHVNVPVGSTINSATLHLVYSVKNQTGTAYTLTQSVYLDGVTPSGWLDTSRDEWNTGARTWSLPAGHAASNWAWSQGGTSRQLHTHNVKPHLDALLANPAWTLAGGSISFLLAYSAVSNPDNIYFHTANDGYGPVLEVNFTPPASDGKETVVNIQENQRFTRGVNSVGAFSMEPYGFNSWFSTYVQPVYSIHANPPGGVTAPPGGGGMLRIEATTGRTSVHFGVPPVEEGEWYNFSAYTYIPATAPAAMGVAITCLGDKTGQAADTTKGQWIRHDIGILGEGNNGNFVTMHASGTVWNNTAVFYMANAQLTKGRRVRPYIDGEQTMTNADYGWAGLHTNGFVRAAPPVVTMDAQLDKGRRKYYAPSWSYSNSAGHAQVSAEIQVRRVK